MKTEKQISFGKNFEKEKKMLTAANAASKDTPRVIKEAWGGTANPEDYREYLDTLNKEDLEKICISSKEIPKEDRGAMINALVKKFRQK